MRRDLVRRNWVWRDLVSRGRVRRNRTAAVVGAALLTGACGAGTPAAVVATGPPTRELRIGLQEYRLPLSAGALLPGRATITVTNSGSSAHDVRLRQGDRLLGATRLLSPGQRQTLSVEVDPGGQVDLDCTVRGHAEAGMRAVLAVTG